MGLSRPKYYKGASRTDEKRLSERKYRVEVDGVRMRGRPEKRLNKELKSLLKRERERES